jgi:hypothetical protein
MHLILIEKLKFFRLLKDQLNGYQIIHIHIKEESISQIFNIQAVNDLLRNIATDPTANLKY